MGEINVWQLYYTIDSHSYCNDRAIQGVVTGFLELSWWLSYALLRSTLKRTSLPACPEPKSLMAPLGVRDPGPGPGCHDPKGKFSMGLQLWGQCAQWSDPKGLGFQVLELQSRRRDWTSTKTRRNTIYRTEFLQETEDTLGSKKNLRKGLFADEDGVSKPARDDQVPKGSISRKPLPPLGLKGHREETGLQEPVGIWAQRP